MVSAATLAAAHLDGQEPTAELTLMNVGQIHVQMMLLARMNSMVFHAYVFKASQEAYARQILMTVRAAHVGMEIVQIW